MLREHRALRLGNLSQRRSPVRGDHVRSSEQVSAHREVELALRDGRLVKEPCFVCKILRVTQLKVDAHHIDYARPLAILWMCRKHHRSFHAITDYRSRANREYREATSRDEICELLLGELQLEGRGLQDKIAAPHSQAAGSS